MKALPFIKMHGAGNDFVFVNREKTKIPMTKELVRRLLDRHFGIGGDQLLVLEKSARPKNPSLTIYNSDGSEAEMCGNGVRAVAHYLSTFGGIKKDFTLQTKAGPIRIGFGKGGIQVDMGEPILEGAKIPVAAKGPIVDRPLKLMGRTYRIHAVSMGNPHCVIFVNNVDRWPVAIDGPFLELHEFFPRRVNVEFVQVINRHHVRARVWERGAGETLACGTGACAIAVASARAGKTDRQVKIDLPGGQLNVTWAKNNHVYLSGPAEVTYEGRFFIK
jgi:diaminopimelate epimerase